MAVNTPLNQRLTRNRTRILEAMGYLVLRFWNNDVMRNIDGVLEEVLSSDQTTAGPNAPSPPPSPLSGERGSFNSMTNSSPRSASFHPSLEATLRRLAAERILVLDGAMGTMIQALSLDEEGYRGARFDAWNREVRGNNDLLNLTPAGRHPRHPSRLFPRRRRHRLDQHVLLDPHRAGRLRHGGDRLRAQPRRRAAGARGRATSRRHEDGRARFVAGAIGPTNRTASISPDVVQSRLPRHHLRRVARSPMANRCAA